MLWRGLCECSVCIFKVFPVDLIVAMFENDWASWSLACEHGLLQTLSSRFPASTDLFDMPDGATASFRPAPFSPVQGLLC